MMSEQFGEAARPRHQMPIIAPKGKRPQRQFILGIFHDTEFTLNAVTVNEAGELETGYIVGPLPYKFLWSTIRDMKLNRKKWWMISHRSRYALEQSDFIGALEHGEISLPSRARRGKPTERGGRLAFSATCLEIDIQCGKNAVKVLDWMNYGIEPPEIPAGQPPLHILEAEHVLRDYLLMCNITAMSMTKTTAAQMGWATYRMNHAPSILMYNQDHTARDLERRAYHAGRNEPFRLGDMPGPTFSLDIKSCYAAICLNRKLPVLLDTEFRNGLPFEAINPEDENHWIADCIISTPAPDYPLKWNETPIYPTGRFKTTLAWPELRHALKHGRVEKITRAAKYKADYAMKDYASWYLANRGILVDAGMPHMLPSFKATFNASLGYSARRKYELKPWENDLPHQWMLCITSAPDHSAPVVHAQILNGVKQWLKVGGETREAIPFLHATICSWARMHLLFMMDVAGRENVHYVDTDGLLCNLMGYANLLAVPGLIKDSPGCLIERHPNAPCRIQGQKNYKIGDHIICAGMVRTRHSQWAEKTVLTTPTGRTDTEGNVTPFEFDCEDQGGEEARYVNIMR